MENIVGHRQYNGKLMYKIRWKNYDPTNDTWEQYHSLNCPDILESYNLKHSIEVPKNIIQSKGRGRPKAKAEKAKGRGRPSVSKRKSSVSSSDNDDNDVPYDEGSEEEYEVDRIVEMRKKKDGSREFLVHWKRWSSDYDTWEPEENLSCPEIIEKFMKRLEELKNTDAKDLRTFRKHTDRFTLLTHEKGRRLSRRNNAKQRVTYFGEEKSDEEN